MRFTVVTVCLNPGDKLEPTLESVLEQTWGDVEVVLKDGGSTDGALERWKQENASRPGAERVRIYVEKDGGIYEAMNQGAARARGEFILFLNCGDVLADREVLERTERVLEEERRSGTDMDSLVLYGDTCSGKNGVVIASAPAITGFTCYRNIPCHQSCFYSAALIDCQLSLILQRSGACQFGVQSIDCQRRSAGILNIFCFCNCSAEHFKNSSVINNLVPCSIFIWVFRLINYYFSFIKSYCLAAAVQKTSIYSQRTDRRSTKLLFPQNINSSIINEIVGCHFAGL